MSVTAKKSRRKSLIKKLDTIFSLFIRARDNNICITCKRRPPSVVMTCGHLITRSKHSVRWDEENAHAQCTGCNYYHEQNSHPYTIVWVTKYGLTAYKKLVRRSNVSPKFTDKQLTELYDTFKAKLETLKALESR